MSHVVFWSLRLVETKLEKEVTFLGLNNRVEIWNTAAWEQLNDTIDEDQTEKQMARLGL